MILTCPDCTTRFLIKDDVIGENGRSVRCSQCSSTWFVAADPDVLSLQEDQEFTDIRIHSKDDAASPIAPPEPAPYESAPVPEQVDTPPPHKIIRDKAELKKVRRRVFGVSMIWGVTLIILVAAALLVVIFRSQIVGTFPGTAPLYNAFGLQASASGLEIYDVETRYGDDEGVPVLFVNGKIKNHDIRARDLALVQLSFKNANGEVLASWVVQPRKTRLKPGETLNFISQYPNPPIDATRLAPSFVNEDAAAALVPIVTQ